MIADGASFFLAIRQTSRNRSEQLGQVATHATALCDPTADQSGTVLKDGHMEVVILAYGRANLNASAVMSSARPVVHAGEGWGGLYQAPSARGCEPEQAREIFPGDRD